MAQLQKVFDDESSGGILYAHARGQCTTFERKGEGGHTGRGFIESGAEGFEVGAMLPNVADAAAKRTANAACSWGGGHCYVCVRRVCFVWGCGEGGSCVGSRWMESG